MPQYITISEYNPEWQKLFERETVLIKKILGDNCIAVYHIGSTSVPGLAAKPIIDIMPVVRCVDDADKVSKEFEEIGYEYLGEFGIPGRRYLRKGGDERTHHIHIFEVGNKAEIERHLAVRDYLRYDKKAADAYSVLKKSLAKKYPYDINAYCDGKDEFVKKLEQTALRWKNTRKCGTVSNGAIRKFSACDIDEVMQIWLETNMSAHSFVPESYWINNYGTVKQALPLAEVYVYDADGLICGFIGLCGSYIAGLFVRNNMQSQGIGAQLIACAKAKKTSLELNVYANNVNAVKFYEREGFVISKEGKDSYTGQKDYHMVWRKDAQALK